MTDLISIVLPVYNGEKYLKSSIDSIVNQTYSNWELLILDDCSTDATSSIADEYTQKDERIKYFRNEQNLMLPRNLNKGFSLAKGDYLTWTSDDNLYLPTALEKMLGALRKNTTAQFAFASCRIIDENDNEIEYITVSEESKKSIVGSNGVGACFLYTRKVYEEIGDYDPQYALVEDFDYWQRVFQKFDTVCIPEILYKYRYHDGALTSTMKQDIFLDTLEKVILKNRHGFGKLNNRSLYYYYAGLYNCRVKKQSENNPYKSKYRFYSSLYFLTYRVPNKIKRMLKRG